MARAVLILALLCAAASPSLAYRPPNGQNDLKNALECVDRKGQYSEFLKLLRSSGFTQILGRYITSAPITLLLPNNKAMSKLPQRTRQLLRGANLIKLVEYHLVRHKFSADYFKAVLNTAFFDTVLGDYVYKADTATKGVVALKPSRKATPAQVAIVTSEDLCGLSYPTIALQGINTVLMPNNLFGVATH